MAGLLHAALAASANADWIRLDQASRELDARYLETGHRETATFERAGHRGTIAVRSRKMTFDGVLVLLGDPMEERGGHLGVSRIDYERRLLPLLRPDLAPSRPKTPHIVVIDPGHGGWATGAENKALKLQEKDLTLDVALRLKPLLEAQGWTVFLTRERDVALADKRDVDLDARAAFANRHEADVFVSIHFDADAAGKLIGSEIFTFAPAHQYATDDWQAARLPGLKSRLSIVPPIGPAILLPAQPTEKFETEMPVNRIDAWSTVLAHSLYARMPGPLQTADLGERIAHWRVLGTLTCPAVLVEPAYISNSMEALRASSPNFRQDVAKALAQGLAAYAETLRALNEPSAGMKTAAH